MTGPTATTGLEIAVVGMAGRFPQATSVDALWAKLVAGTECISFFSDDELRAAAIDPAVLADPNYVKASGVLEGLELFDAAFFGYSPREAALLDPQQRFFLETAWTALEHAGYAPGTFDGAVGVYGGVGLSDYFLKHVREASVPAPPELIHLANDRDFLTTRVSYKLNLAGPSVVVQTACSTSLVAIHMACQGLIAGECDMALAGGITLRLPHRSGYVAQEGGIASPDGHCRAFSAYAQGCLPGNGGAIVVLKRLSDALADRDCVHAIIKGSAINNDGALKVGYTAPSVEGQARVIRSALRAAEASAETIGYLEAHGTGTILGDPIEIQAATQAYRQDTVRKQYCAIGSIKTNLGHLDAGAGVAGFIKAVLAVKHGTLPPSLHCDVPNPKIDFENSPFYVNTTLRAWRPDSEVRRAGVSSFGIGGTNAHVILEEPPAPPPQSARRSRELLIVSAKSERALDESAANLAEYLRAHPSESLADVAFTLRRGRASLPHRRALVCSDLDEAATLLSKPADERSRSHPTASASRLVFMFPGQGAQYPAMGRELYDTQPIFKRHVDTACEILTPLLGFDLRAVISGAATDAAHAQLRDTRIAQPAIFTISHALAQLVMSWGLQPAAMIGHSIGEYVAACLSNVFSVEDALWLVCERGKLMGEVAPGAMLAVALGAEELERLLPPTLALAAINAPKLSVVAGPTGAADEFVEELKRRGVVARPLHTSHAFHSAAMDPVLDAFIARFERVRLHEPAIPYVSNVTGTWITPANAMDPAYWAQHLRRTVRFSEGLQKILEMPGSVLLELGPGETLTTLARRHVREGQPNPMAFATTRRAEDPSEDTVILEALGGLWTSGIEIDWRRVDATTKARRLPLPTYPFQRERFWLEPSTSVVRATTRKRSDPADWFSVPSWERLPGNVFKAGDEVRGSHDGSRAPKSWVVFVDAHGLGDELVARLRSSGDDVVTVRSGSEFARISDRAYHLCPGVAEHYLELCAGLGGLSRDSLKIVHCWTAEPDEAVQRGRLHLAEHQERGFDSLLFLAQALGAQAWLNSCHITVVSSNVHDVVGTETLCPEKATVAGPLNVIPLEYDGIDCSHVDVVLPRAGTKPDRSLVDVLLETLDRPEEGVVAIRGHHRWRANVMPVKMNKAATVPLLKERGVYLITGGLGGVGLALAEHLSKTVQARLVLVGREPPPPKAEWPRWLRDESIDAAAAIDHLSRVEMDVVERVALAPMSGRPGLDDTLDRLSAAYVVAFLARCGVDAREPQEFDRQSLEAKCRVLPRFERLFSRMLSILEVDGFAVLEGSSVRFMGGQEQVDLTEVRRQAIARFPEMTPLFALLDNCAGNFHLALSGDTPAIGLLFGDQNVDVFKWAVQNIREHSHIPLCQELVRELLSQVATGNTDRPLRILEVGGGEGLLTQALLPVFEGRALEYTFTDISRSFIVNAQRLAAERGQRFMRFGMLDISRPPVDQGFARGSFDVAVAFNVMHATKSVAQSLAHVSELLAPGGLLVLQESVRPARWVDLIWGLTDGWWAFEDESRRTVSPLLDFDAWSDVLAEVGFELVTSYPRPSEIRSGADTGVVVARKAMAAAERAIATAAGTDDRALAMGRRIAALTRLEQQGAEVEVIAADVADPVSMRAAIDTALGRFGTIDGVIHAALVLNDGAMQTKTREAAATVLAPKVTGTLVLKEVCEGLDLDFFVIFSSLVSILGGRGQVDYCAASSFQDAFAHAEQRGLARSVVSINWGAWREVGKAFRAAVERGVAPDDALPEGMSPAEGIDAFMRVLASPYPQLLVSPQDPVALIARRDTPASKAARPAAQDSAPSSPEPSSHSEADGSGHMEPRTETERVIARIWQEILGVPQLGVRDNFFDLGGDSMISLQFIAEAKKAGLRFTNRQVFEHQTIAELAAAAAGKE